MAPRGCNIDHRVICQVPTSEPFGEVWAVFNDEIHFRSNGDAEVSPRRAWCHRQHFDGSWWCEEEMSQFPLHSHSARGEKGKRNGRRQPHIRQGHRPDSKISRELQPPHTVTVKCYWRRLFISLRTTRFPRGSSLRNWNGSFGHNPSHTC